VAGGFVRSARHVYNLAQILSNATLFYDQKVLFLPTLRQQSQRRITDYVPHGLPCFVIIHWHGVTLPTPALGVVLHSISPSTRTLSSGAVHPK